MVFKHEYDIVASGYARECGNESLTVYTTAVCLVPSQLAICAAMHSNKKSWT